MERGQRATTPLVELLRNKMDGAADRLSRRKKLTERFRLKGISCCGGGSSFGLMMGIVSNPLSDDEDEDEDEDELEEAPHDPENVPRDLPHAYAPFPSTAVPAASGMNLAAALVAERMFRAVQDQGGENINVDSSNTTSPAARPPNHSEEEVNGGNRSTKPALRVSLMRLLTETDGKDGGEIHKGSSSSSDDSLCCVCMGKKKDAAFIPCGHTFCRGCARDLWFNRGFCPLCNRSILEILDIF